MKAINVRYPENHKKLLFPNDCKMCNMKHTKYCKDFCVNALIEKKMKAIIKSDFDEALRSNIEVDRPVDIIIDVEIPKNLERNNTLKIFVTTQPEGDYNQIILDNPDSYDYLLTSFNDLIELPKARYFVGCTSFVYPAPDIEKKFGVSTIMSGRYNLPGHHVRRELWHQRSAIQIPFDFYLGTHNKLPDAFYRYGISLSAEKKDKIKVFDCMYHIAIDSFSRDNFFSEKLIDCFITNTIPIYWGCTNIDKFFNPKGIIQVSGVDEIINECNRLTPEHYQEIKESGVIEENYQRALEYNDYEKCLKKAVNDIINEELKKEIDIAR